MCSPRSPLESNLIPVPLVIQPPIRTNKTSASLNRAQAEWYNELLGGLHFVGDKVLRVSVWANCLTRSQSLGRQSCPIGHTAKQKEQRAATLIKRAADESKKAREEANKSKGSIGQ